VTSFKRARSDEQRAERRRVILDTAADMLTEMSSAELSLNELSRRACLAKSNVLRYVESREAVLLELLISEAAEWLADLAAELDSTIDPAQPITPRGDAVAAATANSLGRHPVLCDLIGQQAAVLERNLSVETAGRFKTAVLKLLGDYAAMVGKHLPEMAPAQAWRLGSITSMTVGALWLHTQPTPQMLAAFEANPRLSGFRVTFEDAVTDLLKVQISGLLARSAEAERLSRAAGRD
jgi:AcrR family transcriptional regulator